MTDASTHPGGDLPEARSLVLAGTRLGIDVHLPGDMRFAAGVQPDADRLDAADRWIQPVPAAVKALAEKILLRAMRRPIAHGTLDGRHSPERRT
jgi:hypothetical protein